MLNCLNKLKEIGEKTKAVFMWIPGHSDSEGNTIADKLAKKSSRMAETTITLPVNESVIKEKVAQKKNT